MLLRNLDIKFGLCNGTRLRVLDWSPNHFILKCQTITGKRKGEEVLLPRITLTTQTKDPIPFTRKQFPRKLCYAMSIHKAQGLTFHHVGLHLEYPAFAHGLLYVALSRCTSWSDLKVYFGSKSNPGNYTSNIVYSEILS
jgi:ATP-dependent DNA helicase PIF1